MHTSNPKYKMTRQRRIVLEELRKVKTHPTVDEVYDMVKGKLPRISLATVYRNLEMLAGHGVIRKLDETGGPMRFDGDVSPHSHIRCITCGRIDDIFTPVDVNIAEEALRELGYTGIGWQIEFTGQCPSCGGKDKTVKH